jgi:hypothetical protein
MKDTFINIMLFALFFVLLVPYLASATTYYVDTQGTNNASCGITSGSGACATLSYLIGTRHLGTAGDDIQIAAGSYTDNTAMSVPVGVKIQGAGSAITTITTNQSKYIKLQTKVPSVDGNNEIRGFNLTANGAIAAGILSSGRNNQKIHDMIFTGWSSGTDTSNAGGLVVMGKYGRDDTYGGFWYASCFGDARDDTCVWCGGPNNESKSRLPLLTDWATGVEIYNNTFINSKLMINVLKGAKVHDNTINNDNGTDISGIGKTGFWFSGVELYNNTINMNSISDTVIAIELWGIMEDTKVYNNTVSGWLSFIGSSKMGKGSTPYSLEVYGNTLYVSKAMHGPNPSLEIAGDFHDVDIYSNYIASSAADRGFDYSLAIWGQYTKSNIHVHNNVFGLQYYGSEAATIAINDSTTMTTNISDVYVDNNVFDSGPNRTGALIYQNSTGRIMNTFWRNNIFLNMHDTLTLSALSGWTGHFASYNYSFNCTNAYRHLRAATWTLFNNTNTTVTPPGFLGTGAKPSPYYLLKSGSPCIGTGIALGTPYRDIGAYPYKPTLQSPRNLRLQ